jgi:hypothetical protein
MAKTHPEPFPSHAASIWPTISVLLLALASSGCDPLPGFQTDASLSARDATTLPAGPDCASCHKYPLRDINHYYHLTLANEPDQTGLTHPTTCLDCHFNSLMHYGFPAPQGSRYRPLPTLMAADTSRGAELAAEIDTLIRSYARARKQVPWRTFRAHLNGAVDVALAPDDVSAPSDPSSAYRPRDYSCSSINCHKEPAATYRWATPGFTNCPSLHKDDPTCGEVPAPASANGIP